MPLFFVIHIPFKRKWWFFASYTFCHSREDPTDLLKGSDHFSLHTLFVTHGGIQLTYEKEVMIFRYTHFLSLTGDPTDLLKGSDDFSLHTLFVTNGGSNRPFRCLDYDWSTFEWEGWESLSLVYWTLKIKQWYLCFWTIAMHPKCWK